ncbi:MAG: hypothetical protein ACYDEQ_13885 [Desulfocucumaceae bacterium]
MTILRKMLPGFDVEGYGMPIVCRTQTETERSRTRLSRVLGRPLPSSLKPGSLIGDIPVHKGMPHLQQVCPLSFQHQLAMGLGFQACPLAVLKY